MGVLMGVLIGGDGGAKWRWYLLCHCFCVLVGALLIVALCIYLAVVVLKLAASCLMLVIDSYLICQLYINEVWTVFFRVHLLGRVLPSLRLYCNMTADQGYDLPIVRKLDRGQLPLTDAGQSVVSWLEPDALPQPPT